MYTLPWHYVLLVSAMSVCRAHKVLVVYPFPLKSHATLGDGFVDTLLEAGHEVTYITPYPKKNIQLCNLTQIDVSANIQLMPEKSIEDVINQGNNYNNQYNVLSYMAEITRSTVTNDRVQRLLNDPEKAFDLVIAEWMFNELYSGFSAVYNCPLIWVIPMELHWVSLRLVQATWNPEFHPNLSTKTVQLPFSFLQRLQEFVEQMKTSVIKTSVFHSMESKHYDNHFVPILKRKGLDVPVFDELVFSASLLMVNSHVALAQVMPLPPNCVTIGGYHIGKTVPALPGEIQRIMDDATHGVIYFSMGSNLSGSKWPKYLLRDLLELFGTLNQTVLWKLEVVPANIPGNVHILPWAPQQSILSHPSCSIFLTHGGLLSMTEAVHFGVPIIGIPVFADQFANVAKAEKRGFGKSVDLTRYLAEDLKVAIEEVISNSSYKEMSKQLSAIYHDQVEAPRTKLLTWVEYVIRTKGSNLRSPSLLVPWYHQWYLDIILPIFTVLIMFSQWRLIHFYRYFEVLFLLSFINVERLSLIYHDQKSPRKKLRLLRNKSGKGFSKRCKRQIV